MSAGQRGLNARHFQSEMFLIALRAFVSISDISPRQLRLLSTFNAERFGSNANKTVGETSRLKRASHLVILTTPEYPLKNRATI
jgi:hypothetical protein